MSFFSFKFGTNRPNQSSGDNKENDRSTLFVSNTDRGLTQRTPLFHFNTPTERSAFINRSDESAKSQKSFASVTEKNRFCDDFPISYKSEKSSVPEITEDSNALKKKISEELEKIETFKVLSQMEANRRIDEIKELKTKNTDLENRLTAASKENSDLRVKISVELSEREDIVTRMVNTRDMVHRVKDVVEKIENRMDASGEVREAMDYMNEERTQQIQALTQKFKDLDLKHKNIVSNLETTVDSTKTEVKNKEIEVIVLKETINGLTITLEAMKNQKFNDDKTIEELTLKLNQKQEENEKLELFLKELIADNNSLKDKLTEFESRHDLDKLEIEKITQIQSDLEDKVKSLEKELEEYVQSEEELYNKLSSLQKSVEVKSKEIESEIEKLQKVLNENRSLNDEIKSKDQNISEILSKNSTLNEMVDKLDEKVVSIEKEKQELEAIVNKNETLISDLKKNVTDLDSSVESLRAEKIQLLHEREENRTLIEDLESKANESMIEKLRIEDQLTQELNVLKEELAQKTSEFEQKINLFESRINELKLSKQQNETTIREIQFQNEELEQMLNKEKQTLEKSKRETTNILNSIKSDYNKRLEAKEKQIRNITRLLDSTRSESESKRRHRKDTDRDDGNDELDFQEEDKYEPIEKKPKRTPVVTKTYGKSDVRTENVLKGRPTPAKDDDISWIYFN